MSDEFLRRGLEHERRVLREVVSSVDKDLKMYACSSELNPVAPMKTVIAVILWARARFFGHNGSRKSRCEICIADGGGRLQE